MMFVFPRTSKVWLTSTLQQQQSERGLASASGSTGIAGLMMSSATLLNEGLQEELDTTALGRAISGTGVALGAN